jgi:hypothetical protein
MDKKEDFPNPTIDDANRFWQLFSVRHPNIFSQFTSTPFIDGSILAFRPKTMDDNDFRIYERYLKRWLADNGFMPLQIDEIYVSLNDGENKGVRIIDTSTIIRITGIDANLTAVEIKEPDMDKPITIHIKQFVEDLRKNVYIF